MCRAGTAFISLAEAAAYLKTTEPRILMMLKNNQLMGRQEEGGWVVDRASLQLCDQPKPSDFKKTGCGGGCGGSCSGH